MKTMAVSIHALACAVMAAAIPAVAGADPPAEAASAVPQLAQAAPTTPVYPPPAAPADSGAPAQAERAAQPALPAASSPVIPTPSAQNTQTLAQLYDVANRYDALYRAALAQVRASGAVVKEALATMLPQVALQADAYRYNTNANIGSTESMSVSPSGVPTTTTTPGGSGSQAYGQRDQSLVATQPLYRPAYRIAWEQAKRRLNIALAQLKGAKQDLIVRLAQAYFDQLAAQDTLYYLRVLKGSVNQQLTMAQRNFEIGNASITDSREAQARLAVTTAQEIAADNDLRIKRLALEQLVGLTDLHPRPLAYQAVLPAPNPQNVDAWVERAATAPAVQQARLALDVAQLEVDKAGTGHLPTLDLQASIGRSQYPNGNPANSIQSIAEGLPMTPYRTTTDAIGLQLSWSLFSGGAVVQRQRETQALLDKAQAELDNALRTGSQATRAAYFSLQSSLSQVQALQAAEVSSSTALEANQIGYRVGARNNIDVLAAQTQLFQTQRDLAHARYDALVGWLKLKQVTGTLTPVDLAQINNLLAR